MAPITSPALLPSISHRPGLPWRLSSIFAVLNIPRIRRGRACLWVDAAAKEMVAKCSAYNLVLGVFGMLVLREVVNIAWSGVVLTLVWSSNILSSRVTVILSLCITLYVNALSRECFPCDGDDGFTRDYRLP